MKKTRQIKKLKHDPEKWTPVFRKIMLNQQTRAHLQFNQKLTRSSPIPCSEFCLSAFAKPAPSA
jgi:hypothetical protein